MPCPILRMAEMKDAAALLAVYRPYIETTVTFEYEVPTVEEFARRVREICEPKELVIVPHEPFTGAHVGPGMLALFFFGAGR